jgi:4-hydroxy-2-oxoheptanedioate aldolase
MFVCDGGATSAEICAGAGFDYVLIDAEHGSFWIESIQAQLRAVAAYPTQAVVRVPVNDEVLIKQVLDAGAQNIMTPMVHDASAAAAAVRSVRYPQPGAPEAGTRGVGAALARSSRWGRIPDYLGRAHTLVSLIVQIESAEGVSNAAEIAAVEGVDAVFLGPSDLAASMGYLGQQGHPEVVAAVKSVISAVRAAGKIVGVNAFDPAVARDYLEAGANFVNVGADVALLARATDTRAGDFMG